MNDLQTKLIRFMDEYVDELSEARRTENFKRPLGDFVRKDIVALIKKGVDLNIYKVKGSVGAGRWTDVPWIAVFDKRITTSAQKGIYIVYLLNKDKKELYLTLNQGATSVSQRMVGAEADKSTFTGIASSGNLKMTEALEENAELIRDIIGVSDYFKCDAIDSGSKAYDAGCVYYKKYTIHDIPEDEELYEDLDKLISLYNLYYIKAIKEKDPEDNEDNWWPPTNEYSPGLTKDHWISILNDPTMIGPIWGKTLAMFYDYGGEATCSQLAEKYGENALSIRSCCTQLAKSISTKMGIDLYDTGDDKDCYWPVLFVGRDANREEKGSYVWKLRPELWEALGEVDILRFLKAPEEEKMQISVKDSIDQIIKYIASKGFTYSDGLIENFYLSLKSKPFVILAGTSGTGKTKLVKLFADAIGAEYQLVSVRPDWSDGSDLFGHKDLAGNDVEGPICSAFSMAQNNPEKPVFLCLDEMNLARVEYYLSDFLSVIESREKLPDGRIVTSAIAQYEKGIPDNLYIVGTVNMDETTFPFSKKVLDRANTIEFNEVNLIPDFASTILDVESQSLPNNFLRTEYLVTMIDCKDESEYVCDICDELQKINEILVKANAHVGYRVRDEIVFYMLNNKKAENLISDDQAFDNEIMQKILPRIQGSAVSIRDMLIELFKFCMENYSGFDTESGDVGKQMKKMADSARYQNSARKIAYMMMRYEEDGFTSYWL